MYRLTVTSGTTIVGSVSISGCIFTLVTQQSVLKDLEELSGSGSDIGERSTRKTRKMCGLGASS